MKKVLFTLAFATLVFAQNPHMKSVSGGKARQTLMFDGQTYILKFVDQTRVVDLNEYYPASEQPENWTRMVSVSVYKTPLTPGAMAKNMERNLLQAHPDAPHEMKANPDGSVVFMCLNWAGDRQTTSELSIFKFTKHPQGVLGYQASLRPYQAKVTKDEFIALKDRWAQKIQAPGKWPDVVLQMP